MTNHLQDPSKHPSASMKENCCPKDIQADATTANRGHYLDKPLERNCSATNAKTQLLNQRLKACGIRTCQDYLMVIPLDYQNHAMLDDTKWPIANFTIYIYPKQPIFLHPASTSQNLPIFHRVSCRTGGAGCLQ